jgi:putative drug exporter of the RND superfamily
VDPIASEHQRTGLLARIGRMAVEHPRALVIGWIILLVGVLAASGSAGTNYASNFSLPGTESQRAVDLLKHEFPAQAGDSDQIVLHSLRGRVTDPRIRARVSPVLAQIARLPHVSAVNSPYAPTGQVAISPNGQIAFATVDFDQRANELPKAAIERVISVAESARSPQLQVELGGQAIEQTQQPSLGATTLIGLVAAIAILLITFGSLLAMGLPIITALLGLGTGIGLIALGTHIVEMPNFSTELAAMIGLGVGIDYSLFILTRFRENYRRGADVRESTIAAMDTAGRAVLFAGLTVIIALLGMFALGISFLYGLAIAASLTVAMTMLAALTVLPALLSRFGERIGRKARSQATRTGTDLGRPSAAAGFWPRWARLIHRHPWLGAISGLAIMLVLAVPALSLRLGQSDASSEPTNLTTYKAYELLAQGFGRGFSGPLQVVVQLPSRKDPAALNRVAATLHRAEDVASVSSPGLSPAGRTAVFQVFPRSAPQDVATTDLVNRLRDSVLPPVAAATHTTVLVGGQTAGGIDFTHVIANKLPLFIGIVVALSALLLLIVFRSLVIPIQAALMNLLSIGASLGVVVAVFQWGWFGSVLSIEGGPIEAFIPVLLFAIVFGLSMDYEVFLVSRIHEEWIRRRDASEAVVEGVSSTGRVITAAAAIMVCVFISFVLGEERVLKLFGLSLASAVFLDAFVVRSLLLPSVLELLGRATWKLPNWLDRKLPHLAIDAPADVVTSIEDVQAEPAAAADIS